MWVHILPHSSCHPASVDSSYHCCLEELKKTNYRKATITRLTFLTEIWFKLNLGFPYSGFKQSEANKGTSTIMDDFWDRAIRQLWSVA